MFESIDSYVHFLISIQDVAAYIKKEFDKKYNPTWYVDPSFLANQHRFGVFLT